MYRLFVVILVLFLLLGATDNPAVAHSSREGGQCWGTLSVSYATYQLRDELSATVRFIASSIGVSPGVIVTSIARTGEFNYQSGATSVQLTCR